MAGGFSSHWARYWKKWRGGQAALPHTPPLGVIICTFIGSTLALGAVALIHYLTLQRNGFSMLIGSFGATAVLVYACPESPLAQPWNCLVGHFVSAVTGITISVIHNKCCVSEPTLWIAATFSVSVSIAVMQITRCVHPPGGATALIAVTLPRTNVGEGYVWIFLPTLSGVLVLFLIAIIINNFERDRIYPAHWRTPWTHVKPPTPAAVAAAVAAAGPVELPPMIVHVPADSSNDLLETCNLITKPESEPVGGAIVGVPEGMEEALREPDGAINEAESEYARQI